MSLPISALVRRIGFSVLWGCALVCALTGPGSAGPEPGPTGSTPISPGPAAAASGHTNTEHSIPAEGAKPAHPAEKSPAPPRVEPTSPKAESTPPKAESTPPKSGAAAPAGTEEKRRPLEMFFNGGGKFDGKLWHYKGTPGKIVSEDTTFTMKVFDYDPKADEGVATGDPRMDDPLNTLTADKVTIINGVPRELRRAVMEGHVKMVHHPDPKDKPDPGQDNLAEIFTHDVILTCDQATYFYRAKTAFATGHILMVGQDKQEGKPVDANLTADRLEYDENAHTYRAIGNVVIHDGDRTITSPKMVAVTSVQDGKRKTESIDLDPPVHMTGTAKDPDADSGTSGPGTAAGPGAAKPGKTGPTTPKGGPETPTAPESGTKTPAAPATGNGSPATSPSTGSPTTPAPTTPAPTTPAPTTPAPTTPAAPVITTTAAAAADPAVGGKAD